MLTFILANGRRVRVRHELVKSIVTTRLSNRYYWAYTPDVREAVKLFLDGYRGECLLRKVAWYILYYTENHVLTTYLYILVNDGEHEADRYLNLMFKLLEKLRDIYKSVCRKPEAEKVHAMVFEVLRYGIDPF